METYFIYPYVVSEKKFNKYLCKLLHDKNCELKMFEKSKYPDLYTYFLPKVRSYMFSALEFNKNKIDALEQFDNNMQANLLAKYPCTIFEYKISKDIQGKIGKKDGIFFVIDKIEIICFSSGICFLNIKTKLNEDSSLKDLCNFNYKFRNINSSIKENDNIKIQTDTFQDVKELSELIKDIIGNNILSKNLNIDAEKFMIHSFACVNENDFNSLDDEMFYKLANVLEADYKIDYKMQNEMYKLEKLQHIKYGCTSAGNIMITSSIDMSNSKKIQDEYQNEYLYNYIFELYKKIYLMKISNEFDINNKFETVRQKFIEFTQTIWIEEATNDEIGDELSEQWDSILKLDKIFIEVKQKYDLMYKNVNVEKTAKSNKWIVAILIILVIINMINCIHLIK